MIKHASGQINQQVGKSFAYSQNTNVVAENTKYMAQKFVLLSLSAFSSILFSCLEPPISCSTRRALIFTPNERASQSLTQPYQSWLAGLYYCYNVKNGFHIWSRSTIIMPPEQEQSENTDINRHLLILITF